MLASIVLVLEFARLALELRNGVPASRSGRVAFLIGVVLILITLAEALR